MVGLKQKIFLSLFSLAPCGTGAVEELNKARGMILLSVLAHRVVPLVWCWITVRFFWGGSLFFWLLAKVLS